MFYDLNLVVDGVGEQSRREMVAMAMQLGYGGVAANHTFTGVMADSDRCKLRPLELQSVLAAAPGVAEAADFHRQLLGVPGGLPFRQFTRITVVVDNQAHANALNAGNPVLKTYDLVAARPTNQKAFNQACSQLEVDLISLDLSQKLPFRLKMPTVKAAIQRGIYFEISYGRTIFDPKARRELFANAQMLLAAARGRHIILSSGARRALEMRGANDAANMSTLFGLTLESAKAAVSGNCKAVLMHGVMRKATYKGAIHIDHSLVTEKALDTEDLFNVPSDWDPLSLGGASADFIPMDETPDIMVEMDPPLINKSSMKKGKIKTTSVTVAVNSVAVSTNSRYLSPLLSTSGSTIQLDKQQTSATKEKGGADPKSVTSDQHSFLEGFAPGLICLSGSSDVPHGGGLSVNARKENVTESPAKITGKRARSDNTKTLDTASERSGHKKAKRRKKKK